MEHAIMENLVSLIRLLFFPFCLLLLLALPFVLGIVLLGKKRTRAGLIALCFYPALFGVFLIYGHLERRSAAGRVVRWFGGEYEMQQYANDLAQDANKVVDPSELQRWAMVVLKETEATNYDPGEFPRDKVLPSIQNLQSEGSSFEMVVVDETNSVPPQSRTVWICWGSGFGHWGIRIGPPAFKATNSFDDNYYVEWKPGIYFWAQTH